MTESPIVNEWMTLANDEGQLQARREDLLELLQFRFAGRVTADITRAINDQPSRTLLNSWFKQALRVLTIEEFVAYLRQ